MWSVFQVAISVTMVVTGSINTLSVKWADMTLSENSNGTLQKFNHPFLQSSFMFVGETLCLLAFLLLRFCDRMPSEETTEEEHGEAKVGHYSPFLLLPPALCDVGATSIMYVALTLTSASSFQMLRGSIMIFVGIFTRIFLRRKLKMYQWGGMIIILAGLITVGASDLLQNTSSHDGLVSNELLGDILVVGAQVVAAAQFVYEEKFIKKHNIPALKVVGLEGIFGLTTMMILLVIFNFIRVDEKWGHGPNFLLEDSIDGFIQIGNSWKVALGLSLTVISIAFFNFSGVSITKELSAATRKVLDTLRTFVIWVFSVSIGWQAFHYLQPVGFIILVIGMFVYNNIVFAPMLQKVLKK